MSIVKLTYFKQSGKYYTSIFYEVCDGVAWHRILDDCRKMLRNGISPGICGKDHYDILFEYGGVPHLIKNETLVTATL